MNRSFIKYILSGLFVITALAVLFKGFNQDHVEIEPIEDSEPLYFLSDVPVDLNPIAERIEKIGGNSEDGLSRKILPLIVLKTEACTPCLNNVQEYNELINLHPGYYEPTLVFVEKDKGKVDRFVLTTGLELPYLVLEPEIAHDVFKEALQNLLFIDVEKQWVVSNTLIPNQMTFTEHKEGVLNDVFEMWTSVSETAR